MRHEVSQRAYSLNTFFLAKTCTMIPIEMVFTLVVCTGVG